MRNIKTIEICAELDSVLSQYGNINFLSKEELYAIIAFIRDRFSISTSEIFNVPQFCQNNFKGIIEYEFHKFKDAKIGGFLVKNRLPEKSYITVNSSKEPISSIFDLTHEMVHFLLHPEDRKHYISSSLCDVDNFEWQANEGAAELLVPYRKFIPHFVEGIRTCKNRMDYLKLLQYFSGQYIVSKAVVEYRISGLKYEIFQFEKGTPLNEIEFLSKAAQEKRGIVITSYKERFSSNSKNLKYLLNDYKTISSIATKQILYK